MPTEHTEGSITFTFDDGWTVWKYDDCTFYAKHFQGCVESKGVDFVVLHEDKGECWLLEVKDFKGSPPEKGKGEALDEAVARKVRDTLAGVVAAATSTLSNDEDRAFASAVLAAKTVRVCFHCEQPQVESKLFKHLPSLADLRDTLRKKHRLRAVDSKVLVRSTTVAGGTVPWTAARKAS